MCQESPLFLPKLYGEDIGRRIDRKPVGTRGVEKTICGNLQQHSTRVDKQIESLKEIGCEISRMTHTHMHTHRHILIF